MLSIQEEDFTPRNWKAEVKESDELDAEEGINVPIVSDQRSNFLVLQNLSDICLASQINKKFIGEQLGSDKHFKDLTLMKKSALQSKELLGNFFGRN